MLIPSTEIAGLLREIADLKAVPPIGGELALEALAPHRTTRGRPDHRARSCGMP